MSLKKVYPMVMKHQPKLKDDLGYRMKIRVLTAFARQNNVKIHYKARISVYG